MVKYIPRDDAIALVRKKLGDVKDKGYFNDTGCAECSCKYIV